MKKIFKYKIEVTDNQELLLPIGAEILTIQAQDENPCLWALIDPNAVDVEKRYIEIFGTGHPINSDLGTSREYISTFQMRGGLLVFHAFEYTGI